MPCSAGSTAAQASGPRLPHHRRRHNLAGHPPDLNVPFGGLALDGSDTPTTTMSGRPRGAALGRPRGQLDSARRHPPPRAPVTDLVLSRQGGVCGPPPTGGRLRVRRPTGPAIAVNLQSNSTSARSATGAVPHPPSVQRRRRRPGHHQRAAAYGFDWRQRASFPELPLLPSG